MKCATKVLARAVELNVRRRALVEDRLLESHHYLSIMENEAETQHGDINSTDLDEGPSLSYILEEDLDRANQLAFSNSKPPRKSTEYQPSEQQLLGEGKLAHSEFSARLQRVTFGTLDGSLNEKQPACLVLFHVDFCPRNRSWFRFRSATVEVEFGEDDTGTVVPGREEKEYHGPRVRKFYPEIIRGHIRTMADKYSINIAAGLPVSANLPTLQASWSMTRPKESLFLLHGRLMGDRANRVKWVIEENEVNKSGIYERPKFAVIVQHADQARFSMTLSIKATTLAGLPVIGKPGPRIMFTPMQREHTDKTGHTESEAGSTRLPGLSGGSVSKNGQIWVAEPSEHSPSDNLAEVQLEDLTQMEAILLGRQGPGAQAVETST